MGNWIHWPGQQKNWIRAPRGIGSIGLASKRIGSAPAGIGSIGLASKNGIHDRQKNRIHWNVLFSAREKTGSTFVPRIAVCSGAKRKNFRAADAKKCTFPFPR